MDLLDRLVEHDHWAMAELLALSRSLDEAQLDEPFDIGHRTARATLDHMTFNLGFWTALMAGQPPDGHRDDRSLAALADRHERYYEAFATVARRVRDEQRLDDTFTDHYDSPMTFGGPGTSLDQKAVMTQSTWTQALESANDAWSRHDLPALARATRLLVSGTHHDLQYELVAVTELASLGEPSAIDRWRRLAHQLHRGPRIGKRASVVV